MHTSLASIRRHSLAIVAALFFTSGIFIAQSQLIAQSQAPAAASSHDALGGIWVLDRNQGSAPGVSTGNDDGSGAQRRQRGGGGRGAGGAGGGGRRGSGGAGGGGRRGSGGGGGGRGQLDPDRAQAIAGYMQHLLTPSSRLVIVAHDMSFSIVDADGVRQSLQVDNKKAEERAENGLVKLTRQTRWDSGALVSAIAVDNGPKIERRYELSPGGTQLHVITEIDRGGKSKNLQVYARPAEPAPEPAPVTGTEPEGR